MAVILHGLARQILNLQSLVHFGGIGTPNLAAQSTEIASFTGETSPTQQILVNRSLTLLM